VKYFLSNLFYFSPILPTYTGYSGLDIMVGLRRADTPTRWLIPVSDSGNHG